MFIRQMCYSALLFASGAANASAPADPEPLTIQSRLDRARGALERIADLYQSGDYRSVVSTEKDGVRLAWLNFNNARWHNGGGYISPYQMPWNNFSNVRNYVPWSNAAQWSNAAPWANGGWNNNAWGNGFWPRQQSE